MRRVDGVKGVLWLHVESIDIVQPTIPSFRHHWQGPPVVVWAYCAVRHSPLNDGVAATPTLCVFVIITGPPQKA